MKIITKDILTVEEGVICHQVNCLGIMGGGLASSIRMKWPDVYKGYQEVCASVAQGKKFLLLGRWYTVNTGKEGVLKVNNIFGQLGISVGRNTDYGALNQAFKTFSEFMAGQDSYSCPLFFPYKFGSDLGGGDWGLVSDMIEHYFPEATICKLPGVT